MDTVLDSWGLKMKPLGPKTDLFQPPLTTNSDLVSWVPIDSGEEKEESMERGRDGKDIQEGAPNLSKFTYGSGRGSQEC